MGADAAASSVRETVTALRCKTDDVFLCLDSWFDRSEAELAFVPPDVGWPVRDILEHVSLVNHFLILTLRKGVNRARRRYAQGAQPCFGSNLDIFGDIADPDSFDWQPPAHMVPTGAACPAQVRQTLADQHGECRDLLRMMENGEGALHTVRMSVRDLGKLDMYQWLCFLLMHARRHLTQMERAVKEINGDVE